MYCLLGVAVAAAVLVVARGEPLCLAGDFDSQLQLLLRNFLLTPQQRADIITSVVDDVTNTLNKRWQGYTMTLYGSLVTGLDTKASDLDFSVQLRNYNDSVSAELEMLEEVNRLFGEQPELYSEINYSTKPVFARYSFTHSPTNRKIDLIFRNGDSGVQNSKLIRYYFKLDKRYRALGGLLKLCLKIHGLTGRDILRNYSLYLLIIFFLQQKNMAPSGYTLQIDSVKHLVGDWDTGFNELPYTTTNTESVYQLLGGFFKYYSEFDFEKYIVSPFAGRPIPRIAFMDIETFPEEFSLYESNLKRALQLKIKNTFDVNTSICIQDTYIHDMNNGVMIKSNDAKRFKYLMTSAATQFEHLPRDSFLKAILIVDRHNDTASSRYNTTDQNCIDIPDSVESRLLQ